MKTLLFFFLLFVAAYRCSDCESDGVQKKLGEGGVNLPFYHPSIVLGFWKNGHPQMARRQQAVLF